MPMPTLPGCTNIAAVVHVNAILAGATGGDRVGYQESVRKGIIGKPSRLKRFAQGWVWLHAYRTATGVDIFEFDTSTESPSTMASAHAPTRAVRRQADRLYSSLVYRSG
jgi:hypothetical protein